MTIEVLFKGGRKKDKERRKRRQRLANSLKFSKCVCLVVLVIGDEDGRVSRHLTLKDFS
jgi:hypothetical protein